MKHRINRYSADSRPLLPELVFLAVAGCIAWWLLKTAGETPALFVPLTDYWDYAAVLNEWMRNFAAPSNPQVASVELSPLFSPYLALLTLLGNLFGWDAHAALGVGALLNFVIIAGGLYLFSAAYFRDPWAPAISLFVLFFFWGTGWGQHNLYQLGSFLHTAAYPSAFAFGLSLLAFHLTLQVLGDAERTTLWGGLLAVVTALMFLSDPVTSVFGISGCLLLALTESSGSRLRQLLVPAMLLSGLVVAEAWPWFSPWKAVLGLYAGSLGTGLEAWLMPAQRLQSGDWSGPFYDPALLLATLGLALLGVPVFARMLLLRQQPFIVYGVLLMLAPYLLNLFFPVPQGERFMLFVATYLQLAVVWGWLRLISAWSEIPRPAATVPLLLASLVVGAGAFAVNWWMAGLEVDGKRLAPRPLGTVDLRRLPDGISVPQLYSELLKNVPEDAVVLSTADDGQPVPLHRGRVVSVRYDNPLLADQAERYRATGEFFYRPIDELDRVAIIQRYKASHVLLDNSVGPVAERAEPWVSAYGRLIAQRGSYRVYELAPTLHDIVLPAAAQAEEITEPQGAGAAPDAAVSGDGQPMQAGTGSQKARGVVAGEPARPARAPAEAGEDPAAEVAEEDAPRSYGAPIASPVLDPSRHGG